MPLTDLLAFRRWAAQQAPGFGHRVRAVELPRYGRVEFAEWQYPQQPGRLLTLAMVDEVRQFVAPGDLAIDVGAGTGATTLPLALAAGHAGLTIAVEPHPHKYTLLARNATLNRDQTNIEAVAFAATRQRRRITLRTGGGPIEVDGRNLNYLLKTRYPQWLRRFRYLRVATGSYALDVLATLLPTLSERRPVIRCTAPARQPPAQRRALCDFLSHLGYDLLAHSGATLDRISRTQFEGPAACELIALPRAIKLRRAA